MAVNKRKYKSDAFEAIHSAARDLYSVGVINKTTMRSFDAACIVKPDTFKPEAIKRIREMANVSQPVFAQFLNVSSSTVEKWESGDKSPSGAAVRLLSVVQKHGVKVLV